MNHITQISNNRLRELRVSKNLTQMQVAESLGFHTNERISKWESGVKTPSIRNLFMLASIYGVNPSDLYPGLSPKSESVTRNYDIHHPSE